MFYQVSALLADTLNKHLAGFLIQEVDALKAMFIRIIANTES